MNIALLGYGKMGKEIEQIAISRGHIIGAIIDINNQNDFNSSVFENIDVAIDFSAPSVAFDNIIKCFSLNIPIVSGTTGWHEKFEEVSNLCKKEGKTYFYASNYSLGVNLFFHLNKKLASMMNPYPNYDVEMEEIHHIHKLDAPSGTAISLAEGIIDNLDRKSKWVLDTKNISDAVNIKSTREGEVPGIHEVVYDSEIDYISIKHSAKNRKGFALGAVLASEFIFGKVGVYSMDDMLNL